MLKIFRNLILITILSLSAIACSEPEQNVSCPLDPMLSDPANLLDKQWVYQKSLKGGLSGFSVLRVYDSSQRSYVLKDIHDKSIKQKIAEIYAHKTASLYGYGPTLHAYDVAEGKLLYSFLSNTKDTFDEKQQRELLADALDKLHNGPDLCDTGSIIDQINILYSTFDKNTAHIEIKKIGYLINKIYTWRTAPKSPTHRDLNPNNILFTDTGVKFIDFENAGQDDPFFDIASIIVFYQYDDAAEKEFCLLYFGQELSAKEQEHLNIMKKAVSLFYGLTLFNKVQNVPHELNQDIPELNTLLTQISNKSFALDNDENLYILSLSFLRDAIK